MLVDNWNACSGDNPHGNIRLQIFQKRGGISDMRRLSNEMLIDSYYRAIDLKLEQEFIDLLVNEIKRRDLPVPEIQSQAQAN